MVERDLARNRYQRLFVGLEPKIEIRYDEHPCQERQIQEEVRPAPDVEILGNDGREPREKHQHDADGGKACDSNELKARKPLRTHVNRSQNQARDDYGRHALQAGIRCHARGTPVRAMHHGQ